MLYRSVFVLMLIGTIAACGRDFDKPGVAQVTVLRGRVLTDDSQAVNGARVRLLECGLSTITGPDGRFSMENVPNGDYIISADAQVKVQDRLVDLLIVKSEPEPLRGAVRDLPDDLVLKRTGEISGTLSLSDYSSPLGAVVYVEGGFAMTAVSDDGGFVLKKVPAGKWYIGASKAGYQLAQSGEKELVEIQAGGAIALDLELEPILEDTQAELSGLVYLSNPGPERGVEVVLSDLFASVEYKTFTDTNGMFSLSKIPAGLYELHARHPAYRSVGFAFLPLRDGDSVTLERPLILPKDDQDGTSYPWDDDPTGNTDDDGDGIRDIRDNCPVVYNPDQMDWDGDGVGNLCDSTPGFNSSKDADGDGVEQSMDNCPDVPNPKQTNSDLDPLGDACDPDMDNDGWLNEQDKCPKIADVMNNASLCNWAGRSLIYSAQEDNTGDIYLYRADTENGIIVSRRLNTGHGQSWGATVTKDGWIFYHHRPGEQHPFRLCLINMNDASALPTCFDDWGDGEIGDQMNPAVCTDGIQKISWLFYERYSSTKPGWRIFATELAQDLNQTQEGQELVLTGDRLHLPPPRSLLNFRYPSCHWDGQRIILAHAVDFRQDTGSGVPDLTMEWNLWSAEISYGAIGGIYFDGNDSHENVRNQLRSAWSPSGWFFEQQQGGRVDLMITSGQVQYPRAVIADGYKNMHPAFLSQNDTGGGIVAYQSNAGGSFDIYLMPYPGGASVQITHVDGWAGSPTWYVP